MADGRTICKFGENKPFCWFSLCLCIICFDLINCDSCTNTLGDKYDITPLAKWPWEVKVKVNNTVTSYKINICANASSTDSACPANSSICRHDSKGATSIGNYSQSLNVTEDTDKKELWLYFHGTPCPDSKGQSYMTAINIKCGSTLGSPKFLESYACDTYFEWTSTVACKKKTTVKEVPCYVYNKDNKKINLTPLIMTEGAYRTDTATYSDFYINVCRAITPGNNSSLSGCSPGSAACQTHINGVANMGGPADRLQYDSKGHLILHYNTSLADKPSGCVDTPSTTITFMCPKRGGGQNPKLTSFFNCQYQVLWETEYACPEETLTSNTCKLSQEQHGIDIDLTPLKNDPGTSNPHRANFTSNGKTYVYFINLCDELGIVCPTIDHKDGISVCQKSFSDPSFGKSLGRLDHQKLRYSDDELTMTYSNGDACFSHFKRTTVITFHCNQSAEDNGRGRPVFNSESNCTYLFDWSTKHACVNHPKMCRVNVDKKQFDLAPLIRTNGGKNWEALSSHLLGSDASKTRYFINICGDILKSNLTNKCPDGAAACSIDENGKARNLGQFTKDPAFSKSGDIQLVYSNGESCNDKTVTTTITLTCKPGDLESGPVLVHRSADTCFFDFRWQTAAACVLGRKIGTNCRVSDNDAGFNFDLSRLTQTGDPGFYSLNDTKYDYFINVCAPIKNGKCKDPKSAACQVNKKNVLQSESLGQAADTLYYFDGMINLTYSNGDNYNTQPPIPRKTELVFLCDPNAGIGHPEFHHEGNHSYTFRWFTKYACAEAPLECIVTDPTTKEQYDLSSLSKSEKQQNWERVDDANSQLKRKFYLNVCRPLNPVHVHNTMCDAFAAACMSEFHNFAEKITITNLGHAVTAPTLESKGKILLKYTNGAPCTNDAGKFTNYTTTIHLQCTKGELSTSPSFVRVESKCEYVFLWETSAACPIVDTVAKKEESCTVKDAKSGYVYNLQPLMKKGTDVYNVDGGDGTSYKLNLCAAVPSCGVINGRDAAVCQVKDGKVALNLGTEFSQKLLFSDDGSLTLTYEGGMIGSGDRVGVEIRFVCSRDKPLGDLKFLKKEVNTYMFKFETSLACRPQAVDCLVSDQKGNQYDLTTLSKVDGSWMVPDSRPGHSDLQYYINVCRPISSIAGTNCPGGPVGGCQVSLGTKANSHGMGYIQSNPVAVDGTVSIRYMGGDICHQGTGQQNHRSTRIIFQCSPIEHSPIFLKETPECEYVFEWMTPAACAVQQIVGHECKVTDPLYHMHFDLNPLHKSDKDYHVQVAGGYEYLINVCGPLKEGKGDCDGSKNVGVCQTKTGTSLVYSGGLVNSDLKYEDGEITVEYVGGTSNCHGKYTRSTILKFLCDHDKIGSDGPVYVEEKSDCTYMFTWLTSRACPPFKKAEECNIRDKKGHYYDFSSLTQSSQNYEYTPEPATKGIKFFINVCASVVHGKGSACPFNSAACLVNVTEKDPKKKYRNIGEVNDHMLNSDENGNVKMKYINGDTCKNGKNATTTINMICEQHAFGTKPEYAYAENDCDYHFNWLTSKACPDTKHTSIGGNCTTTNPATGYKFDLSSLKTPGGYEDHDKDGHTYMFNICGKISDSMCSGNSGICQSEEKGDGRHFNLGDYSDKLMYDNGIIVLNYTNGDKCHQDQFTRNTVISFVCGEGDGNPMFIQETSEDCTYYISWHTKLACEKQVQCLVDNGTAGTIDLSPLIKNNEYYLAVKAAGGKDPKGIFYINVCRPLNPIRGTLCPPGSAACRVEPGKKPVSLGQVTTAPFIDKDTNKVTIVYDHGVKCDKNLKKNTTSRIVFSCVDGTEDGQPRLEDVTDDCVYVFSWGTSIVCSKVSPVSVGQCKFKDPITDKVYDLSSLRKPTGSYSVPYGGNTYYVNLCGGVADKNSICKTSGVCTSGDKEVSFGQVSTQKTDIGNERITISYADGDPCLNAETGRGASHILLECDPRAGKGKPVPLGRSACSISFLWRTSLVCPPVAEKCSITDNGNAYDLSILSREQGSWNLTDAAGNWYWINICQGIHLKGTQSSQCPPGSAVCRKMKDGTMDILGTVSSQQLTVHHDGKLVLKYMDGTDACSHGTRRSDKPPASVVIEFECASTVGGPVLLPSKNDDSSCVFRFQWKTRMACKVEREKVQDVSGYVTDPRSGGVVDLTQLYSKGFDYRHTEHRRSQVYEYTFSLEGKLNLPATEKESSVCKGAVVCQKDMNTGHTFKNLGSYSKRIYYMEDDILEGVYLSDQKCDFNKSEFYQSIIVFHCDDNLENKFKRRDPTFTYQSRCTYLFDWYSSAACIIPKVQILNPLPPKKTAHSSVTYGTMNPSTVGSIVGVFSGIIIICVLVIVFHKKERRIRFTNRVRRIFKSPTPKTYQYSVLAQGEDDDFLLGGPTIEEDEVTNGDTPVASYHDDSDDDLIP